MRTTEAHKRDIRHKKLRAAGLRRGAARIAGHRMSTSDKVARRRENRRQRSGYPF